MNLTRFSAFIIAALTAVSAASCQNASSSNAPAVASVSASALSSEESRMLDMLIRLSHTLPEPSSLELTGWVKGSLKDSSAARELNRENGYALECIAFTDSSSSGTRFANTTMDELAVFGESEVGIIMSRPDKYLSSPEIYGQDSIQRINAALKTCLNK